MPVGGGGFYLTPHHLGILTFKVLHHPLGSVAPPPLRSRSPIDSSTTPLSDRIALCEPLGYVDLRGEDFAQTMH